MNKFLHTDEQIPQSPQSPSLRNRHTWSWQQQSWRPISPRSGMDPRRAHLACPRGGGTPYNMYTSTLYFSPGPLKQEDSVHYPHPTSWAYAGDMEQPIWLVGGLQGTHGQDHGPLFFMKNIPLPQFMVRGWGIHDLECPPQVGLDVSR
jgi:hypothetical protein